MSYHKIFEGKVHGKSPNPMIPKPEAKEHPVTEVLTHEEPKHFRPLEEKPIIPHKKPHYNILYGSLGTEGGWRYVIDNFAVGTVTTIAGQTVATKINLALVQNWRLDIWPGAVSMYLVLRRFSMALQTATLATLGAVDVQFVDSGGQVIPLGDFISNAGTVQDMAIVCPTPITDPSNLQAGTLNVALSAGATVGTYNFQLGFAGAFLIPALRGYELELANSAQHPFHHSH